MYPSVRSWLAQRRWLLAAAVVLAAMLFYFWTRDLISLAALARREENLREFAGRHYLAAYAGAFLLYVLVTGLSLPAAATLSLAYAWLFGFWRALLLVSFASTAGATLAMLLSRYLLRNWVEARFGLRLKGLEQAVARQGALYLFSLRLIPAVPFFLINLAMGLTTMPVGTFWWVSQLGMLPGTAVYVYAGASAPSLAQLADPSRIESSDVRGWPELAAALAEAENSPEADPRLRRAALLLGEELGRPPSSDRGRVGEPAVQSEWLAALDRLLDRRDLFAPAAGSDSESRLEPSATAGNSEAVRRLNRRLLDGVLGEWITPRRPIVSLRLLAALTLVGVFPLASRWLLYRLGGLSRAPAQN